MSRYIDAEWLKSRVCDVTLANGALHGCIDKLDLIEAPSIDVVTCGECKHFLKYRDLPTKCVFHLSHVNANDFCSYGLDGYVGEYNAVLNAVNVIKSFIDKHGAESGSSYWKSNIDDEILVTDWGYVEEGLELLKGYCLKLMKGAD